MSFDPNNLSAGNQQGGSGDPERPLTRRELREREARLAEDRMAEELERQMQGWRPEAAVVAEPVASESVVESPPEATQEEPVLLRRDRSNRPPLATSEETPAGELAASVAEEVPSFVFATEVKPADAPAGVENSVEAPAAFVPVAPVPVQPAAAVAVPVAASTTPAATAAKHKPVHKIRIKHKTRSAEPKIVAPVSRKRRGAQIFSMVAMAFVAGLAIATSVPATALLSPEDVALQSEQARLSTLPIGDGQSVEGTGDTITAGRDGVSVTGAQAAPTAGAYAPKKLNVNVPVSTNGMRWPVDEVKISSPFGDRNLYGWYNFHTGLDFDPAYGTPIYAVADGIVSLVENPGPTCGVAVFVEHNLDGTKFTSVYCHMIVGSPPVTAGQTVKKGDLVGNIGLTGVTTGPHLHLEIRINDAPVDPYAFIVQRAGKAPNEVRD